MLPRRVLNSWAQGSHLPLPLKVLGLQAWAKVFGQSLTFKWNLLHTPESCYIGIFIFIHSFIHLETKSLSVAQECSGMILAHCNLCLWGSSDSHVSASQVAGTRSTCHHTWLLFCIFSRDRVSPCWLGLCWTPDLRWSARFGLPECWDYRRWPLCLDVISILYFD